MAPRSNTRAKSRRDVASTAPEPARTLPLTPKKQKSRPASSELASRGNRQKQGEAGAREVTTLAESHQLPLRVEQDHHASGRLSGTTARTSVNSAGGSDALLSYELVDKLMRLNDASSGMIDLLAPPNSDRSTTARIRKRFSDGTGVAGRSLKSTRRTFKAIWRSYGDANVNLNVPDVVRRMLQLGEEAELPSKNWRPDDILYRANLARTLEEIYSSSSDDGSFDLSWTSLEEQFPAAFFRRVNIGRSVPLEYGDCNIRETFNLALEIRTQFYIRSMVMNDEDALSALDEVFGEGDKCKGWDVDGLRSADLEPIDREAMRRRKEILLRVVDRQPQDYASSTELVAQTLDKLYPIPKLVQNLISWISRRSKAIDTMLDGIGKIPAIQEGIEHFTIQEPADTGLPNETEPYSYLERPPVQKVSTASSRGTPTAFPQPTRATPAAKARVSHKLRNENKPWARDTNAAALSSAPDHITRRHTSNAIPSDVVVPSKTVGAAVASTGAHAQQAQPGLTAQERGSIIAMHRKQEAEADKENSAPAAGPQGSARRHFIDAQANRDRIAFEDTQPQPIAQSLARSEPEEASSSIPTQDGGFQEGFEEDTRPIDPVRKRAAAQPPRPEPSRKRHRTNTATTSTNEDDSPTEAEAMAPAAVTVTSWPSAPAPTGTSERTPYHTPSPDAIRFVSVRRVWPVDQSEYLRRMIAKFGCRWADIKAEDGREGGRHILDGRSQVDLKDRARNMKVQFLRDRMGDDLPKNFEFIALKTSDKRMLQRLGVPRSCLETAKRGRVA